MTSHNVSHKDGAAEPDPDPDPAPSPLVTDLTRPTMEACAGHPL
jgi:hypothetical protein